MRLMIPQDYQPQLASRFMRMRERVQRILPESLIEHIGSSAIPGALSKGDLDICVLVPQSEHAESISKLTGYGYIEKQNTLRTEQLCMLEWHQQDERHAIQLVARGSPFEMFIAFREALRSDASLVMRYNEIKREASHGTDSEYREAKSMFIERVLKQRFPEITASKPRES